MNRIIEAGVIVKVVNTLKFKVVNESVKKTDRHDARTLAEFLEKDMLPASQLCSQESEDIRRVIKSRATLVKAIVSLKNQVYVEVKKLEKILAELVKGDEDVELLKIISRVGSITSSIIIAPIDDIQKFDSAKKYAGHAGLVPWVQNSNMTIHHRKITKRGSVELRTAFVQVIMGMIKAQKQTQSYRLIRKYKDMKQHKESRKLIIAAARKMSTVIYTMLKHRGQFNELKMAYGTEHKEIQAAVFDVALAEGRSA